MDEKECENKLHNKWKDKKGNELYLESTKGKYKFSGREEFEDRLFSIRINDSERFFITHEQQLELMKSILWNDILPHRFIENCEKFLNAIYEIKGERKKLERTKYNVELSEFAQKDLWSCFNKEAKHADPNR